MKGPERLFSDRALFPKREGTIMKQSLLLKNPLLTNYPGNWVVSLIAGHVNREKRTLENGIPIAEASRGGQRSEVSCGLAARHCSE
jgi:hypothetical protein